MIDDLHADTSARTTADASTAHALNSGIFEIGSSASFVSSFTSREVERHEDRVRPHIPGHPRRAHQRPARSPQPQQPAVGNPERSRHPRMDLRKHLRLRLQQLRHPPRLRAALVVLQQPPSHQVQRRIRPQVVRNRLVLNSNHPSPTVRSTKGIGEQPRRPRMIRSRHRPVQSLAGVQPLPRDPRVVRHPTSTRQPQLLEHLRQATEETPPSTRAAKPTRQTPPDHSAHPQAVPPQPAAAAPAPPATSSCRLPRPTASPGTPRPPATPSRTVRRPQPPAGPAKPAAPAPTPAAAQTPPGCSRAPATPAAHHRSPAR